MAGLTLLIWFAIPAPAGVDPNAWHLFALFIGTIVGIISKAMPLGSLSMIAIALVAITGVTNPDKPATVVDALSGFANPLIWLIVVAVMVAVAVTKTGLGRRIGYCFVMLLGQRTIGVAYGLVLSELVIAPVMPSNTARGGAIIHPIMRSIADSYGSSPEQGTSKKIGRFLALVNYNTNPITSAMFITATAPSPLRRPDRAGDRLEHPDHLGSVGARRPVALRLHAAGDAARYVLYPPEIKQTPGAKKLARAELEKLGPMRLPERITLGVLIVMLAVWAGLPAWLLGPTFGLDPTTTALIGLALLLSSTVLDWSRGQERLGYAHLVRGAGDDGDVFRQSRPHQLVLAVAGDRHLAHGARLEALSRASVPGCISMRTTSASTTAHVTAMFAAFFAAGIALGAPPMLLGLVLAFSSSLNMSLTHYATGTAPIIFGSGYTTLNEWFAAGAVMSVVNLLLLVAVGGVWWTLLGYI